MHLFSRAVHLVGPPADTMTYAADMRRHVADATGRDISLWAAMIGAPLGSMVYSMWVDGLADLQQATEVLTTDAAYHEKIAAGRQYAGAPSEDNLATPIYGAPGDQSPPVGTLASITTAVMAAGRYSDAIAWGLDVSQHVESLTGLPTMFLTNDFGPFGRVTWIGVMPDGASADSSMAAVNGDGDYLAKLHAAGDLFVEGSGHRMLIGRVA
jgi:hypothetical protein